MGWMASWVAVQGAAKEELIGSLGLVETEREVEPGSRGFKFCVGEAPGGWLVIFSSDLEWGEPARVVELSRYGPAVGLQFEDKVEMQATACGARDGVELWRIHHHNDPIWRLDVSGEPPAEFAEIHEQLRREQEEDGGEEAEADFIHDVPLEVAKAACGFRVDDDHDVRFRELVAPGKSGLASTTKGGFFRRLFGLN